MAPARLGSFLSAIALLVAACAPLPDEHKFLTMPGMTPPELAGELYRPEGDGPFPAVILLHGSEGMAPRILRRNSTLVTWAEWLRTEGYVAFIVDSFSDRNLKYRGYGITTVYSPERAFDILSAARYLKGLPFIQGQKLGVMGWSHGGGAVLGARNRQRRHPDLRLQAMVAFYPICRDVVWVAGTTPLLLLIGEADALTPAEDCRALLPSGGARGESIQLVTYPDAHHAFDNERLPPLGVYLGEGLGRGEILKYDPEAHRNAKERVRRFLEERLKN
jgi:dienelactone hydrolase